MCVRVMYYVTGYSVWQDFMGEQYLYIIITTGGFYPTTRKKRAFVTELVVALSAHTCIMGGRCLCV